MFTGKAESCLAQIAARGGGCCGAPLQPVAEPATEMLHIRGWRMDAVAKPYLGLGITAVWTTRRACYGRWLRVGSRALSPTRRLSAARSPVQAAPCRWAISSVRPPSLPLLVAAAWVTKVQANLTSRQLQPLQRGNPRPHACAVALGLYGQGCKYSGLSGPDKRIAI